MIEFHAPATDAPELALSPLHRAAMLTLRHLIDVEPVGLTPNKALKRYFVAWAVQAFAWPGYTCEDLYAVNKVLNESDFPPLGILHDILLAGKLVQHRKGMLHATQLGKAIADHGGSLWISLAQHLLFAAGPDEMLEIEWVSVLKALDVEAHAGVSDKDFAARLLGRDEKDSYARSLVYLHVLRPLVWLGLLHETHHGVSERLFTKTALWPMTLTIENSPPLLPMTRH